MNSRETLFRYFSNRTAGVAIITAKDEVGDDIAVTVSSLVEISVEPSLTGWFLQTGKFSTERLQRCRHFGVSILTQEQREIAVCFSRGGEREFYTELFYRADSGVLLVKDALASCYGVLERSQTIGDHEMFVMQIEAITVSAGASPVQPLIYFGACMDWCLA